MDPKYLQEMLELCSMNDFIFASRYLKDAGSEDDDLVTLMGNKIFSLMGNILFNLKLSDILFTYILGKTSAAKNLDLKYSDFRICVEIPIKAKLNNLNYDSIPSKERKRIGGFKKVNALKDGFMILTAIMSLFLKKYLENKKYLTNMLNLKNICLYLIFVLSLFVGFIFQENASGGAKIDHDFFQTYINYFYLVF